MFQKRLATKHYRFPTSIWPSGGLGQLTDKTKKNKNCTRLQPHFKNHVAHTLRLRKNQKEIYFTTITKTAPRPQAALLNKNKQRVKLEPRLGPRPGFLSVFKAKRSTELKTGQQIFV